MTAEWKMIGKKVMAGLLAVCFCVVPIVGCSKKGEAMNKEKLDQILKNDLPVGTPETKVAAYLNSKKIEYSVIDSGGKKIQALVRDVDKGSFVTTSVQIVFSFDGNDNLMGFVTENKFTGP